MTDPVDKIKNVGAKAAKASLNPFGGNVGLAQEGVTTAVDALVPDLPTFPQVPVPTMPETVAPVAEDLRNVSEADRRRRALISAGGGVAREQYGQGLLARQALLGSSRITG